MYRSFTAEQYKEHLGFQDNYCVDAVLCYGTLYEERTLETLQICLKEMGIKAEPVLLAHPFLRFARELTIGDKKLWFMIGYGGAWLSEYLHWACLFGSKKNILVGSCGGLKPGMKAGDFIIPESSFAEESSVRIYNRDTPIQVPDEELSTALEAQLSESDTKIWRGPMVTCQAMIGETMEDVKRWSKDGYYAVEMEASTVFAVSQHLKVPAAAIMYIGDNLIENHHNMSEDYAKEEHTRELRQRRQIKVALKELLKD